ncbi:tail assembly protein [Candidatus Fukatsuia endosymbiont of Tuberolachnus salignus]|uniref:tail assembly protein n=1 Tax=Candidatus Fukatsuia endosymbiont of Tuberolachnus salignus TaxID=3077957 RepID=UPI00313D3B5A
MAALHQPLRTVRLYGKLGHLFGRVHHLAVETPREAIKALSVILPGFEQFMLRSQAQGLTFAVFNGQHNISREELASAHGSQDIRIAPVIIGSKRGGLFQTIIGAMLVAASFIPGAQFLAPVGISMMVGGVIQMLSPQQSGLSRREDPDNKPSYAFGEPVNSTAQGNPVPIGYGKRRIGGAVISAGIYAEDQM